MFIINIFKTIMYIYYLIKYMYIINIKNYYIYINK